MPRDFLSQIAAGLAAHDWQHVTSLAAVSGGADSVALLRALAMLRDSRAAGRLIVVHFHHGLRGNAADRDAQFVQQLAESLGLHCVIGRASGDVLHAAGDSLEAAARDARYRFFIDAANDLGARFLFTAHTADDQAETILHRILRGTGVDGLSGIPRVRELSPLTTIVRPLLDARRHEVLAYLAAIAQPFCDDHTNLDPSFTRNRLRHDLLPKLAAEYNPQVVEALLRLGALAGEASEVVSAQVASLHQRAVTESPGEVSIACDALHDAPSHLIRSLFIAVWQSQSWPLQAMSFDKWRDLAELAQSAADRALDLPGGVRAVKRGERCRIFQPEAPARSPAVTRTLPV